jgi:DDE superfamily endonuclease
LLARGELPGYPGTVATTWALAFTRLEQTASGAVGLLPLLAFADHDVVYASYAAPTGHAVIEARLYMPKDWANDHQRCQAAGIPDDLQFNTKPQLAAEIVKDLLAEGRCPPWVTGDDVYGRDTKLRSVLEDRRLGYALKIPCSFRVTLPTGQKMRADHAARLVPAPAWQTASAGHGSKGERDYDWAWLATASPRHHLLIRRHLRDHTDLAYFYCHVPTGRPCSFTTLIRIAGRRWPVEEVFRLGKTDFGLADSQVRRYIALTRHLALTMAALAICATTAALARPHTSALARPPTSPDDLPPEDPGLIPLTVTEIKRVFNQPTRAWQSIRHYLHWSWWRRRHQARARWFHHRARLRRQAPDP